MKSVALIIAKKNSSRLKDKNFKDFCGQPMFVWNLEKCLKIFDEVYVSSDYGRILKEAKKFGAVPIRRPDKLCKNDVPSIPVYQHALKFMDKPDIIVTVKADSPTLKIDLIKRAKELMEKYKYHELMTAYPVKGYENKNSLYGSVWALTRERLENYNDSWKPEPEILLVDESIDIHTKEDFIKAKKQQKYEKK